jgi:hypothetical protein
MTEFMRAWRKANRHVRAGQHAKAVYWLERAQAMLDQGPRRHDRRFKELDLGYLLTALFIFIAVVGSQHW